MNAIAAVGLSALLTWALNKTSKDIGNKYPSWSWIVAFVLFAVGFANIK